MPNKTEMINNKTGEKINFKTTILKNFFFFKKKITVRLTFQTRDLSHELDVTQLD
jgi:hypothetical protein